jgi:hypothetical protein
MALKETYEREKHVLREVRERNRDLLVTMWRAAIEDAAQCTMRYHCHESMVQLLKGMTLKQVLHAADQDDLLFEPRFDADKLAQWASRKEAMGPVVASPEMTAMAYATAPIKKQRNRT